MAETIAQIELLKRDFEGFPKRMSYAEDAMKQSLAFKAENAMKQRITDRGAFATGELWKSIIVVPRGNSLVVTVGQRGGHALFVDEGVKPHVVKVDGERFNRFKQWANKRGLSNNPKGPFFTYGPNGKPRPVTLNHKGNIYLYVGKSPSNISKPGIRFVDAGIQAIDANIDRIIVEETNKVIETFRR